MSTTPANDNTGTDKGSERERLMELLHAAAHTLTADRQSLILRPEYAVQLIQSAGFGDVAALRADVIRQSERVSHWHQRYLDSERHAQTARGERDALAAELADWEEREARVCPEDVGFEEHIAAVLARAEQAERDRDDYKREWESACERANSSEHLRKEAEATAAEMDRRKRHVATQADRLMHERDAALAESKRMREALTGVVRVADRKTDEFDAARAALAASAAAPAPAAATGDLTLKAVRYRVSTAPRDERANVTNGCVLAIIDALDRKAAEIINPPAAQQQQEGGA